MFLHHQLNCLQGELFDH
jgi:hypothetical protein